jgi:hypothetical protein
MPRQIAFAHETWDPRAELLPVPVPAAIWAHARREFAIGPLAQLPLRARLLDVLEHLDRGHLLALLGTAVPAVALEGHPDIALLAGVLFTYGYVQIAGQHRDNPRLVYFTLSEIGQRKLAEGRAWWNGLSFWQRLRVRLLG